MAALGSRKMTDTRQVVLRLFEAHRETPGAPFEEGHFLDFLLSDPHKTGSVKNSFRGLRRYNAFIEQLQLELGVFLSVKDYDTGFSLQKFVDRVEGLRRRPASSLASLHGPMKGKIGAIFVVVPLLFWLPALGLRNNRSIAVGLFACGFFALLFLVWFHLREREYLRKVHRVIKASKLAQQAVAADRPKTGAG